MDSNKNDLRKRILLFLKNEMVLVIAIILAIITSFFSMPKIEYINFKVLALLFNLMIIVAAFKKLKLLDSVAITLISKCSSYKSVSFILVFLIFISSMFVTNDVALITFVPLTLIIANKINVNPMKLIIVETLAANLGSSLTPMGNPQNLFLYSFFNISSLQFFKITGLLTLVSCIYLIVLVYKTKDVKYSFEFKKVQVIDSFKITVYIIVFVIIILSVFHIVNYIVAFIITILTITILNKELLKAVDYSLLITFIALFIFIGNISQMEFIKLFMKDLLSNERSTYISSILLSQFISNVPAAILISGFTTHFKELILGVNIGGMGTIIASMASLISYKFYIKEYREQSGAYLKNFTVYNVIGLIIIGIIFMYIR